MGSSQKCGAAAGAELAVLGCLLGALPGGEKVDRYSHCSSQPVILNCLPFYLHKQLISKQPGK